MIFTETNLKGAFVIDPEPIRDDRGFFARAWCKQEFAEHGLNADFVQANISFNEKQGTLRGMHYQSEPHSEAKLVRCTKGSVYDVIIDLRERSDTYKQWFAINLSAENYRLLYIPEGFAHGFQTLSNASEMFYLHSNYYAPQAGAGVRWDDPVFAITWPIVSDRIISERDRSYPDYVG